MKRIAFFGLCFAATVAASAQMSVVKDAEHEAKAGKYEAAMKTIKPAMSDPATAALAQTYFIPGKAGIDLYTELYLQSTIGKPADKKKMGHALMDGIDYLIKALPLDSTPDEKGKVKPKYSKNIIKLVNENYNSLNNAAIFLWEDKDYQGAYDAWQMFIELPANPVLGKNAPKQHPDSTLSDIYFNQGLAAWQIDNLELSLNAFKKAIEKGYNKNTVFDYAINHAARLGKNEEVYALAEQAYERFGNANPLYLQLKINSLIEKKKYDEATQALKAAIDAAPDDAQLYNIQGVLFESLKDNAKAKESYFTATQKDSQNANALYNYARMLCNEAYALNDEAQAKNMNNMEYQEFRTNTIDPLFKQASQYLEDALAIDHENRDIRTYLRNVYYNLGDEQNLKRIEDM